jgi:hypothetical protein
MKPLMLLLALAPDPPADVDPSTGKGPEWGKAAPVGLLVILLLCIAVFFLLRSMTRRINRVPGEFAEREHAAAGFEQSANADRLPVVEESVTENGAAAARPADPEAGPSGLVNERSG